MRLKIFTIALLSFFMSNISAGEFMLPNKSELTIPKNKSVIKFDTKLGTVTFAHKKHAGLSITECTTCHHKYESGDTTMKPCHECHLHKVRGLPKAKTAFHTRCTGCHEYTVEGGQKAGPLQNKCKLCHKK